MASRLAAARSGLGRKVASRRGQIVGGGRQATPPTTAEDYVKAYYEENGIEADGEGDEEGDDETVFPMWKSVGIAVLVIACFASIYPKLLHPLLMYVIGFSAPDQSAKVQEDSEAFSNHPHPSMRHGGAGIGVNPGGFAAHPSPGSGDRFPSPASRMAAGRGHHHFGGGGGEEGAAPRGGNSTWHWLLPFYTIGVIIFLIYTLGKILWRRPKLNARHRYNMRYNASKDRFEVPGNYPGMEDEEEEERIDEEAEEEMEDDEEDEDEEDESLLYDREQAEILQDVRGRGPDALSNKHLQSLQTRLHETESAMQTILAQLEQLSSTDADPSGVETVKKNAAATLSRLTNGGRQKAAPEMASKGASDSPPPAVAPQQRPTNPSVEKKRRSAERSLPPFMDTGEPRYINDLERALSDFQFLSENYGKQGPLKGGKKKEAEPQPLPPPLPPPPADQSSEEGSETESGVAAVGFDTLESDRGGSTLIVEPGEGEITAVSGAEGNPEDLADEQFSQEEPREDDRKKRVRRRKARKVSDD